MIWIDISDMQQARLGVVLREALQSPYECRERSEHIVFLNSEIVAYPDCGQRL